MRDILRSHLLMLSVWLLAATTAQAVEDCTPYLEEMDAKIAAAEAAGQNVSMARQIRDSVLQACPFMDDASLRKMADGLDAMFPAMSEFADMQAQMDSGQPPAPSPTGGPRSPAAVPDLPEIGRTLGGHHVDRPDAMHKFSILDMDVQAGRGRVLYQTYPDRLQFAGPDWEFVVYVLAVGEDGKPSQRLITRKHASDLAAVALRRGADEVLVQRQATADGSDARLERWSIAQPSQLSSVPVPSPAWAEGRQHSWGAFAGPTSDGNLFFIALRPEPRDATQHTTAWFETTPEGHVVGQGAVTRPEMMSVDPIEANGGRSAVLLMVRSTEPEGVTTRLNAPIRRNIAAREIHATVGMERRILLISDDGHTFQESPALERMLIWQGDMAVPQDLPMAEMMRQNQLQMTTLADVDREVDAGRHVVSLDMGLKRVEMIRPMRGDRYAALVEVVDDRDLEPPNHGAYLLEVDPERVVERVYLEPLAEALNVRFRALAVSPGDAVYLYAESDGRDTDRVIRVSPGGVVEGYASLAAGMGVTVDGLVADDAGVWVFGRGVMEGIIGDRVWVERVVFDR